MEDGTFQRVKIDRVVYNQEQLRREYEYGKPKKDSPCSKLNSCSVKNCFLKVMPVLDWLPHYKWKRDFPGDLIAGITVAIMHIPQGMAYSLLGNVPAVVGIYMAFFPVLVYFLFGTSKHNSMGTFAIVCLMTGKTVLEHSHPMHFSTGLFQNETIIDESNKFYSPVEVATIVTFTVALFQLLMYILQLGIISTLLSETLISGFITGAAFQVLTSQIKDLLGLEIPKHKGYFVVYNTWKSIFQQISNFNHVAIIISVICIILMVFNNEFLKPKLAKKAPFPIPIELIVVVFGTFASQYWELDQLYNVQTVGHIPNGFPPLTVPKFALMQDILIDAFTIAVVSYAMSLSMALIFAQKLSYEVDANQELLAQSAGNVVGSFFSCMPFTASISRSLIQQTVGGKTQITSLVSCGILALVLMWIGPLFQPLPKSVLASIIIVALKGMLFQIADFVKFWKLSKLDASVWSITFLTVIFISIDIGLLVGLILSLATIVILSFKPYTCLLGFIPQTDIYLDKSRYKLASELTGIKIFCYQGGINFASRNIFKSELCRLIDVQPQQELIRRRKLAKLDLVVESSSKQKQMKLKYKTNIEIKCIILDFSGVSYIDPSGISTLKLINEEFQKIDIPIYVASPSDRVYEMLKKCDLLNEKKKFLRIFPTIHDAVHSVSNIFEIDTFAPINTICR